MLVQRHLLALQVPAVIALHAVDHLAQQLKNLSQIGLEYASVQAHTQGLFVYSSMRKMTHRFRLVKS